MNFALFDVAVDGPAMHIHKLGCLVNAYQLGVLGTQRAKDLSAQDRICRHDLMPPTECSPQQLLLFLTVLLNPNVFITIAVRLCH